MPNLALRCLRTYLLLCAFSLCHEGAHALAYAAFGYPVSSLTIGIGPALLSTHLGGMDMALAPLPLGAYVIQNGSPPWWASFFATLAGPALILLHPIPRNLFLLKSILLPLCRSFPSPLLSKVTHRIQQNTLDHINSIGPRLKAASNIDKQHPLLSAFPITSLFTGTLALSFWDIVAFLSIFNLLPVPPLDGGHALYYILPQSNATSTGYSIVSILSLFVLFVVLPLRSLCRTLWGGSKIDPKNSGTTTTPPSQ